MLSEDKHINTIVGAITFFIILISLFQNNNWPREYLTAISTISTGLVAFIIYFNQKESLKANSARAVYQEILSAEEKIDELKLGESGYLLRDLGGKVIRVNSPDDITGGIALLPLLGNARCGLPLDQIVSDATKEMVPIPLGTLNRGLRRALYLVRAIGRSMEPKIENDDLVIFEPSQIANNGQIVVARTQEGFVIKRFKETASHFVLESVNREFDNLAFNKSDEGETFNIDGVAIGVFKPEDNLRKRGDNL